MSEQEQQDVDSGHNAHTNAIIDEKPTDILDDTAKVHKVGRHHKKHKKYPSSKPIHAVPQTIDIDTEAMISKEPVHTDTIPVEKDSDTDIEKTHSIVVVAERIADTPLPSSIEETYVTPLPTDETNTPVPVISTPEEPVVPRTPSTESIAVVSPVQKRSHTTRRVQLVYALLALLLISTVLLLQDLTATHLYVNTIDAKSGGIRSQQDLGSYRDTISLTAPLAAHAASPVLLGVYVNNGGGTQQLLTLNSTTSTLSLQHSLSLANGAITYAANGNLLVESASGLQVVAQDGQVVWQIQGQQPTHGVHHFQPVSDTQAVYTIKSVTHSQVAAFDLMNGHIHWTQTLNDTLEYAPPFLLDAGILYVASDHNVFALNSSDGTVLWEKPYASRTLLLESTGQNHLLIALGSQGMQALQSATGEVAWWFRGNPTVSTLSTQFYQGSIGSMESTTGNTIYATGVVWQMPQVRESVWLYAIDAATGEMRWSQQIASGLLGVDAGRGLQPLLAINNGLVVVQRAVSGEERDVTAYDTNTGTQRWNTHVDDRNTSSPIVFQVSQSTFALFTTMTNSDTILWTPSLYRDCILLLLLISVISLLVFLLRKQEHQRTQGITRSIATQFTSIRRRWRYGYTLFALVLLLVCIGINVFAYTRSEQSAHQLLTTDAQGSIVITGSGDNMHQLEALNPNGTTQWKLFSSEGVFSLPNVHIQTGTLLVALHGRVEGKYRVAEDDPAYSRPLDTMLALYLLNRSTGHVLWQHIVSYPDERQDTEVIGTDATYIYIAGEHTVTASAQPDTKSIQTTQLFAVNKLTGAVDWRIFGPTQSDPNQYIHSTLLLKNGQAFWHVAETTLIIDTNIGQIIARK